MPSNILAIVAAVLGILAAIAAGVSALQANRETDAAVRKAQATADVKIAAARADADVKIAKSNAQSAEASKIAAQATERAAALEAEAAKLLERLGDTQAAVSGRRLEPWQASQLVQELRERIHHPIVVIGTNMDAETETYAAQLQLAFIKAGIPDPPSFGAPGGSSAGNSNQITMYIPGLKDLSNAERDPVYLALHKLGIAAAFVAFVMEGTTRTEPDYYAIRVEPRGPTYFPSTKPPASGH